MEKQFGKRSIHTVIYLLLAAMLASVVGISLYTVASRRSTKNPEEASTEKQNHEASEDTSRLHHSETTAFASDTASDAQENLSIDTEAEEANATITESAEIQASIDIRYFVLPVVGAISKDFEIDIPVYSLTMNDYRAHTGVDLSAELGSEVVAASSGIVSRVWRDPLMGCAVTIDHGDGIYTTYKNLSEELAEGIEAGAGVTMGQLLGAVGESALIEIAEEPHLHFEMQVNGEYVNPMDYVAAASEIEEAYEG